MQEITQRGNWGVPEPLPQDKTLMRYKALKHRLSPGTDGGNGARNRS